MATVKGPGVGLVAALVLTACAAPNQVPRGCGLEGSRAPEEVLPEVAYVCYLEPRGRYNGDILVMRPGERARLLTHGEGVNLAPRWSPDGKRIAFTSTRSGTQQLYVMNAEGNRLVQITRTVSFKGGADWAPDGTRIVYSTSEAGISGPLGIIHAPGDLYVAWADGSGARRLTFGGGDNTDPSWSPDGSTIAFFSDRDGPGEIWLMNADGSNQRRLTDGPPLNASPSWSPDGARIAFHSERDFPRGYESGIYVMNADGSDQHIVTRTGGWPDWSADGRWILFADRRDGPWNLYTIHPDGSGLMRLTSDTTLEWLPRWRPE